MIAVPLPELAPLPMAIPPFCAVATAPALAVALSFALAVDTGYCDSRTDSQCEVAVRFRVRTDGNCI